MPDSRFIKLLNDLSSFWENNSIPVLNKLEPGIEIDERKIDKFSGDLPSDVRDLFRWKNGVASEHNSDPLGTLYLFPLGILLSVGEVILTQDQRTETEYGWERTKLPLFEDGGGEYFLIDCESSSASYGQIIYYSIGAVDFERTITIYDSLFTLFETIYECNKRKVYNYETETGQFTFERFKNLEISRLLNPKSKYWKLFD